MNITKISIENKLYPKKLLDIKKFPTEIYVIGNTELLNYKNTIAIVGSRNCTEYGRTISYSFAEQLAKNNFCIVSGMAIGIDAAAHDGATNSTGKTIAVLGGGFNHIFPKENEWLFHKILNNGGCIISEYSPDTKPDKAKFPQRNRIISGISDSILVVEAGYRSGSSITVKYARAEGKTIYAIPSCIDNGKGLGTNILIQQGAKLVTKVQDIIKDMDKNKEQFHNSNMNLNNINNIIENKKISDEKNKRFIKNKNYLNIYKILSDKPLHINEIAKKLNKTVQEIMTIITLMELDELVYQVQTNYFVRKYEIID